MTTKNVIARTPQHHFPTLSPFSHCPTKSGNLFAAAFIPPDAPVKPEYDWVE